MAGWWRLGLTIEEMAEKQLSLRPAEIHAALAHDHLNRAELEADLVAEREGLASAPAQTTTA
jgi:hypothetical protein